MNLNHKHYLFLAQILILILMTFSISAPFAHAMSGAVNPNQAKSTTMAFARSTSPSPVSFKALSAVDKQILLWRHISKNPYKTLPIDPPKSFWSLHQAHLFSSHFLIDTFKISSDIMPDNRDKLVHTYGSAAKIRFVPNSTHTTGLLSSEFIGIIRLSLAKLRSNLKDDDFIPGFGLKALRGPGVGSLNLVAMPSLKSQEKIVNQSGDTGINVNFFAKSFTTLVPDPGALNFAEKGVADAFDRTIQMIPEGERPAHSRTIALNQFVEVDLNGKKILEHPVRVPAELIFTPDTETQTLIRSDDWETDFRNHLTRLPQNSRLFLVNARWQDGTIEPIGDLILDSTFVSSPEGDRLFFQHPTQSGDSTQSAAAASACPFARMYTSVQPLEEVLE